MFGEVSRSLVTIIRGTKKIRIKEKFKSNFLINNKIRLCDSKTKTQDVQDKRENKF